MNETVLQERVTLGEALVKGLDVYPNGCNFKILTFKGQRWLTWGCYCLPNLATGYEKLLVNWMGKFQQREILGVNGDDLSKVMSRPQCSVCGGDLYQVEGTQRWQRNHSPTLSGLS